MGQRGSNICCWGPTHMPPALSSLGVGLQLNTGTCPYSLKLRGRDSTFLGIASTRFLDFTLPIPTISRKTEPPASPEGPVGSCVGLTAKESLPELLSQKVD